MADNIRTGKYQKYGAARALAICPKCSKTHFAGVQWSGSGVARIFCPICKIANTEIDQSATYHVPSDDFNKEVILNERYST